MGSGKGLRGGIDLKKVCLIIGIIVVLGMCALAEETIYDDAKSSPSDNPTSAVELEETTDKKSDLDTDAIKDGGDNQDEPDNIAEDEILVTADDELAGDEKKVTIKGDVNIRGSNFTAKGNIAEVDLENNVVRFSGGVRVVEGSKEFTGDELVYNYKTKTGTIKGVRGHIENEKFKDDIYLYGHNMSFEEKFLRLEGGRITTCNLENPHYHIAAKIIEIYEDDKLVMRNLYYKEGKLPLLYLPYWQVSLKEKKNYWKFPQFGSSAKEGFFVKLAYVYTLNNYNKGEINIDYLNKLGIGQGLQHAYSKDQKNLNTRYYLIYSPFTNELKLFDTSGSFNLTKDKFKLSGTGAYKEDYTEFAPKLLKATSWNYSFSGSSYTGNLRFSYSDENSPANDKEEVKLETSQSLKLSKVLTTNLGVNLSYYQKANQPWITVLSYDSTLNYNAKYLSGTLKWQQEDKSQEEATTSTYSRLFRQPELVLRTRSLNLLTWPIMLETTIGHYKEEPKKIESDKLSFRGVLGRKTYKIATGLNFNLLGEGQGTVYNLKNFSPYVLSWRSALGLSYQPAKNWNFTFDYTKRDVYGNSPFSFDKLSNIHALDFSVYNNLSVVTTQIKTGYDLVKATFKTLSSTHRISYGKLTANLEHDYNLVPFEAIKVAGNIKVEPMENLSLEGRINYSKDKGKWQLKELNGKGILKYGLYGLRGEAVFNPQTNKYTTLKVTLSRDLHCRELDLTYDSINKAVWLEFKIKAIGDKPMKVKLSGSGVEFSSDMLSALSSGN